MSPSGIKVVQINLHHCEAATDDLLRFMGKERVDVALIQEPWLLANRVRGLRSREFMLLSPPGNGRLRSCILYRKGINMFLMSHYSNEDLTVAALERRGKPTLLLASMYLPYEEVDPPSQAVRTLVEVSMLRGHDLVIGCDANAHHTLWGSTDINKRGESLFDYLLSTNLIISNRGETPTFYNRIREQVIDVTLVSDSDSVRIEDWRVSLECSFSDHHRILFSIDLSLGGKIPYRNPRKTNWIKFRSIVQSIPPPVMEDPVSIQNVESSVNMLTKTLTEAYLQSCPERVPSNRVHQPWWTPELKILRTESRKLFNKAKKNKKDEDWENYRLSFNAFKRETRRAKRESWHSFCEELEGTTEAARLRKVLSKDPSTPGFLMKPDGSFAESSQETIEILMNTHFPGCEENLRGPVQMDALSTASVPISGRIRSMIDEHKVTWAVKSFKPFKSAGPDGIFPALLQESLDSIMPWLLRIFMGSLASGYIPTEWREVRVVFIPKAGKINHNTAKDYRPISLSSFLLKTLERLVDVYVRSILTTDNFSRAQHAYLKGRSVETALHEVVGEIEGALHSSEYMLASFLDVEGAFNNVNISSIIEALDNTGTDPQITRWTGNMLKSRAINSKIGDGVARKVVTRGTPQGGVISPLLWNLVINRILDALNGSGTKVIAYADDVVLLVRGKHTQTISDLMESSLRRLLTWARDNGLGVNPAKTELVLFTRAYKIDRFELPKLDGVTLTLSNEAKYLGVILDSKLSWKRNTEERRKKALCAFYTCRKTFGKRWGLQPYIIHWMYTAIIRPILIYGSLVWWRAVETNSYLYTLQKVQRLACLSITGAMRSAPQAALEVMLNLPPIDIYVRNRAARTALRLRETHALRQRSWGHSTILSAVGGTQIYQDTDYILPVTNFGRTFVVQIPSREAWASESVLGGDEISVFTDGSKMDMGTGSGIFSGELGICASLRLPDFCSVFQAEICAIDKAAQILLERELNPSKINICVDSLAALKALESNYIRSKCVRDCITSLSQIHRHSVRLIWVPGHSGVMGNENADECARKGSESTEFEIQSDILIPLVEISNMIDGKMEREMRDRWTSLSNCRISRTLWPLPNRRRTKELLSFGKRTISIIIGVLTGHCLIGRMAERMGFSVTDYCRSCGDEEEEETIEHFLCECPGLKERRLRFLGRRFFDDLDSLREVSLSDLADFVRESGYF